MNAVEAESSVYLVSGDDERKIASELKKSVNQLAIVDQKATEETHEAIQKLHVLLAFDFKKFLVSSLFVTPLRPQAEMTT